MLLLINGSTQGHVGSVRCRSAASGRVRSLGYTQYEPLVDVSPMNRPRFDTSLHSKTRNAQQYLMYSIVNVIGVSGISLCPHSGIYSEV